MKMIKAIGIIHYCFDQERLEDTGTLLYPSITICPKYIWENFPGVLEILNNNKSLDFNDIKKFALDNYWSKKRLFNFVSHNNVLMNHSFPCNTISGSQVRIFSMKGWSIELYLREQSQVLIPQNKIKAQSFLSYV